MLISTKINKVVLTTFCSQYTYTYILKAQIVEDVQIISWKFYMLCNFQVNLTMWGFIVITIFLAGQITLKFGETGEFFLICPHLPAATVLFIFDTICVINCPYSHYCCIYFWLPTGKLPTECSSGVFIFNFNKHAPIGLF